jgi:hypothetical protein
MRFQFVVHVPTVIANLIINWNVHSNLANRVTNPSENQVKRNRNKSLPSVKIKANKLIVLTTSSDTIFILSLTKCSSSTLGRLTGIGFELGAQKP